MTFTDLTFIFIFLPVFVLLYRLLPAKVREVWLCLGSLFFYGYGTIGTCPWFVVGLVVLTLLNYTLYVINRRKKVRICLILTISVNLAPLLLCKLLGVLPLGISFYIFQAISLQLDFYKEDREMKRVGFWEFCGFLTMFPKLTMGPLVRFRDTLPRPLETEGLERGLQLFTVGLAMKMLLADRLSSLVSSIWMGGVAGMNTPTAWVSAVAYTMELYFDFWGYSLMAMGIGSMMGIPIPSNFHQPYAARTVSEFWRRWHVTLGQWFRDYVYIPMGGSKKSGFRTVLNLLVVWILTTLWHGFGWNFLIWGGVTFLLIVLEKFTFVGKLGKTKVAGHLYLLLVMPVLWTCFYVKDVQDLFSILKCMIGICENSPVLSLNQLLRFAREYGHVFGAGVLLMTPLPELLFRKMRESRVWQIVLDIILLVLFWLSVYGITIGNGSGFLYYQF